MSETWKIVRVEKPFLKYDEGFDSQEEAEKEANSRTRSSLRGFKYKAVRE